MRRRRCSSIRSIFASDRPHSESAELDIYYATKEGDRWSEPIYAGPEVNSDAGAGAPTLSPDGRYLFFKKRDGPERGLYWISTDVIQQVRERVLDQAGSTPGS